MAAVLVVVLVLVPLLVSSPFHFLLALSRFCFQHYYYYYFFESKDVVLQCLPASLSLSLPDSGAHMSSGIAQEEEEEGYRWQMILGKQQQKKKKKKNFNVQDRKK